MIVRSNHGSTWRPMVVTNGGGGKGGQAPRGSLPAGARGSFGSEPVPFCHHLMGVIGRRELRSSISWAANAIALSSGRQLAPLAIEPVVLGSEVVEFGLQLGPKRLVGLGLRAAKLVLHGLLLFLHALHERLDLADG